jgi:hypothetical protein
LGLDGEDIAISLKNWWQEGLREDRMAAL